VILGSVATAADMQCCVL